MTIEFSSLRALPSSLNFDLDTPVLRSGWQPGPQLLTGVEEYRVNSPFTSNFTADNVPLAPTFAFTPPPIAVRLLGSSAYLAAIDNRTGVAQEMKPYPSALAIIDDRLRFLSELPDQAQRKISNIVDQPLPRTNYTSPLLQALANYQRAQLGAYKDLLKTALPVVLEPVAWPAAATRFAVPLVGRLANSLFAGQSWFDSTVDVGRSADRTIGRLIDHPIGRMAIFGGPVGFAVAGLGSSGWGQAFAGVSQPPADVRVNYK